MRKLGKRHRQVSINNLFGSDYLLKPFNTAAEPK
jgi:hypothetical protein